MYSTTIGNHYRLAGFLTVISYGLAAVLALFLTEVRKTASEQIHAKEFCACLRQMITDKYLVLFLLGIAFLNETHQTVTIFLNQLLYVRTGLSNTVIGYLYIIVTIVGMCGIFSYKITQKKGYSFLIRVCFVSASAACVLLALTQSAVCAALGIITLRAVFGLFSPLQTRLQNEQIVTANRAHDSEYQCRYNRQRWCRNESGLRSIGGEGFDEGTAVWSGSVWLWIVVSGNMETKIKNLQYIKQNFLPGSFRSN